MHNDFPLVHLSGKSMPQSKGGVEGDKASSCLEANECTRNFSMVGGESNGE